MKDFIQSTILLGLTVLICCNSYSQSSTPYLAPGATAPTQLKSTTTTARVASSTPAVCDAVDIRVFPSPLPQSEIHISINKQNPQILLLSSNTFPLVNSWQGAYWSTNGGLNWAGADDLPNGLAGRGDPSTAFDALGRGYVATMTRPTGSTNINDEPNGYSLARTIDNGTNWLIFNRVANNIIGFDKEMIGADDTPGSPFANNLYSAWSVNPGGSNSSVGFHRSTDGGNAFGATINLKTGWGQGTNVQTGPNGEVYVCWADYTGTSLPARGLGFVRSINGGQTFTASTRVFTYTGIRTSNGANANFNGIRVNDFPSMAVDKGNGPRRGRIYVVYAAKENGNGKAVVQIRFSDNTGTTWSAAQTISIANGRQNWFPWIAVDNTTGIVYIIYYSLDEATGFNTNTYVAISTDGGVSFTNQRVSDVNHVTAPIAEFSGGYCGDYIGITAHNGVAYPSWTDNRNGQWQNYVSPIQFYTILGDDLVCGTSNPYTVTNIFGGPITWTSSNPAILTIDNNGVATRVGNGEVTITATVTSSCGNSTCSKTVKAGNYLPIGISSYQSNCSGNTFNVLNTNLSAACTANTSINFSYQITDPNYSNFVYTPVSVPSGATWSFSGGNLYMSVTTPPSQGSRSETIALSAAGPCGNYNVNFTSTAVNYSSSFSMSPNPSKGNVTVSMDNENSLDKLSQNLIYAINITDQFGTLGKSFEYKDGTNPANISLQDFNSGSYILSVFDGKMWSSKQLIVQK